MSEHPHEMLPLLGGGLLRFSDPASQYRDDTEGEKSAKSDQDEQASCLTSACFVAATTTD